MQAAARRHVRRAASPMDLLEYQGKQLFAKHGIAVPSGEVAVDRRGGRRRRRADRLPLRDQGPGADRRARQGRRDQDRRRRRGGARARRRDPRHGHRRPARRGPLPGRPGLGRGRLGHRLRVLRLGDPRPLREEAAGDGLRQGRDGHRGGRRRGPRRAGQAPHRPDQALRRRRGAADRRRRRARRGRRSTRSPRCWSKLAEVGARARTRP